MCWKWKTCLAPLKISWCKMRKYIFGSGVTHHPCFVVVQNADQGTCKNPRKELLGYNKGHAVNLSWNETGIRGIWGCLPHATPARNKAILGDYSPPLSLNNAFLGLYFLGGSDTAGGSLRFPWRIISTTKFITLSPLLRTTLLVKENRNDRRAPVTMTRF